MKYETISIKTLDKISRLNNFNKKLKEENKKLEEIILNLEEGNKDLYNKLKKILGRMGEVMNYINDRIEDINNGGNEKEYKSIIHIKELLERGEDKWKKQ
jgi:hypothetical protein